MKIGFVIYPGITMLDFAGPAQFLNQVRGAELHVFGQTLEPHPTDAGFSVNPTHGFDGAPQMDLICVPGGPGQAAAMASEELVDFVRSQGESAKYVTSVCTGSLLLGQAGLLRGYRAACHWVWRDQLTAFGAKPVDARVVRDRNRITGGGVTAGIDFALTVIAEIAGEDTARFIQLALEYDPAPPFDSGSPDTADPALVTTVKRVLSENLKVS